LTLNLISCERAAAGPTQLAKKLSVFDTAYREKRKRRRETVTEGKEGEREREREREGERGGERVKM